MKKAFVLFAAMISTGVLAQFKMSRADALNDIAHYHEILNRVHYNPYQNISRKEYAKAEKQLLAGVGDSIAIKDFTLLLYRLTALLGDGHTAPALIQSLFKNEYRNETFFPCQVVVTPGSVYLPEQAGQWGIVPGSQLLAINGRSAASLLATFTSLTGGTPQYRSEMAGRLFPHFLFLLGEKAPFTVSYFTPDGTPGSVTINDGVRYRASLAANMPHMDKKYDFRVIDNKLGYLNFMSMSGKWEDFGKFADSCFTALDQQKIPAIAIDLRQNSGGDSMLADVLLSYLTKKKYNLMGKRYWKVSREYKDYLRQNGETGSEYLNQPDGTIWQRGDCTPRENDFVSDKLFTGKIFFIMGPFTYSSANMLADAVKQYKLGTIVGEVTGENVNDFGEVYPFTLPKSGIRMNLSTSYDIGAACNEKKNAPVLPDIPIYPSVNDKVTGRDLALDYILRHIP